VTTPRTARLALAAGLIAALCCTAPESQDPRPAGTGALAVRVVGFENDRGQALVNLFLGPDGFPGDPERAWRAVHLPIRDGQVEIVFEEAPAGPFAISVFHDEDADFELDQNLLGIPSERWGVSRDAGGFLGPPSWDDAQLVLAPGEHLAITVEIG